MVPSRVVGVLLAGVLAPALAMAEPQRISPDRGRLRLEADALLKSANDRLHRLGTSTGRTRHGPGKRAAQPGSSPSAGSEPSNRGLDNTKRSLAVTVHGSMDAARKSRSGKRPKRHRAKGKRSHHNIIKGICIGC